MLRFSANLSTLFTELPFLDRFAAARDAGFHGVEFQFPYEYSISDMVRAKEASGLSVELFNLPAGDWIRGERGIGALAGREAEFESGFRKALEYALALSCPRLHAMAGIAPVTLDERINLSTFGGNLRRIAPHAENHGISIMIEPINIRDVPGYALSRTEQAFQVMENVQCDNILLQLDLYHRQIMQGDLVATIEKNISHIGHIQIASVPGRNEPDTGEVNYEAVFERLDQLGYAGFIGCEYIPKEDSWAGLQWLAPYLK